MAVIFCWIDFQMSSCWGNWICTLFLMCQQRKDWKRPSKWQQHYMTGILLHCQHWVNLKWKAFLLEQKSTRCYLSPGWPFWMWCWKRKSINTTVCLLTSDVLGILEKFHSHEIDLFLFDRWSNAVHYPRRTLYQPESMYKHSRDNYTKCTHFSQ